MQGHRNKLYLINIKLKVSLKGEASFKGIVALLQACRVCTSIKLCKCEESGYKLQKFILVLIIKVSQ